MKQTELLRGYLKMRFEEVHVEWEQGRLTQEEAARMLGVCDRTFRRYLSRYRQEGIAGLSDMRSEQLSHLRASADEVVRLVDLYKTRYIGWNVKHFYSVYKKTASRSYTWVKNELQRAGVVKKAPSKGKHRKRRERSPMEGMMLHQDGSTHLWIPEVYWDLIITLDDATNEHYSMFFMEQESTASSFRAMKETIEKKGLPCSLYTDRGTHYWKTPEAGGKVDKINLTQFGRAMKTLGIDMIAAYSPEARGRCERMFKTHQDRLTKELALEGITSMEQANDYLKHVYMPAFNDELSIMPKAEGSAFVPHLGVSLQDILCEHHERTVGKDNCVSFESLTLQIPHNMYRMNYVKTKVRVHRYHDNSLAIFHGPRKLADYDKYGVCVQSRKMSEPQLTPLAQAA